MPHNFDWKWYLSDLETPENAPTVFSTFACGGGSSMGYKRAGYNVLGCCEIDPRIATVYKKNLHPKLCYEMDIRDFNNLDDLPKELYHLDILDGSPPCSTFSMSGNREKDWGKQKKFAEGQSYQRLDDLFFHFLDTVEKLKPKVVVAENVTGLLMTSARGYVHEIIKRFQEIGYGVQLFKLNSMYMDVPQKRERVFFIANRCNFPKLKLNFNNTPIPFGKIKTDERIDKELTTPIKELLPYVQKGEQSLRNACIRKRGKSSFFGYKIAWDDKVVNTIETKQYHVIRYETKDYATDGDIRNISSFPQDYDFSPSTTSFICGMSVPVNMMANVALEIKKQWLDNEQ